MHATDARWTELGKGEYGPAKAMMFGRLKFTGPKVEAMSVMSPFGEFLKLAGSVAGEKGKDNCPPAAKAPDAK
jgi:putative sterol carrier protein